MMDDTTLLDEQLQRLRLHYIRSHYQDQANKAAEQHHSHVRYLGQLIEGEATMSWCWHQGPESPSCTCKRSTNTPDRGAAKANSRPWL